ncbi:MAG: mannose-6-phosphate isomerase, class I [Flavisolibacter sp.]
MTKRLFKIKGVVQHYSWGGFDYIPRLLGKENTEKIPYAEYWLGAHPNHPSRIDNPPLDLAALIREDPAAVLGKEVANNFHSLPFLLKILDVRQMLSIQVHPDKKTAALEFARENEKGIPLTAAHRNYKDENHKPELMVALGDFWLLHGFKNEQKIREILTAKPSFHFLLDSFNTGGYRALYEEVMNMDQAKVNQVLQEVVAPLLPLYRNDRLNRVQEDFWAARAATHFCKGDDYDRGIFSIYLFNLVNLKKGQGIFQPQGMPHAYLEGQNVEVMANSDNVLRAGLTDKHIDVPELMKHVSFQATLPDILEPTALSDKVFPSPAAEFELHQYSSGGYEGALKTRSAEIWLLVSGTAQLEDADQALPLGKGEAIFVMADTEVSVRTSADADLFRVVVPRAS